MPDNGGDTSGLLVVQTGGGSGISCYKLHGLRPAGATEYSDSLQGAAEFGTSDKSQALLCIAGVAIGGATTYISTALVARVDNAGSNGVVIYPNDSAWDSRVAWAVGNPQINAAPVNVQAQCLMNGDLTVRGATMKGGDANLVKSANDGTWRTLFFQSSRAGAAVALNEILGDIAWLMNDSASAQVVAGRVRLLATNVTHGSHAADWVLFLASGGAEAERFRVTAAGRVGVGTGAPDSPLSVSSNASALQAPLTGTMVHVGNADATATRIAVDSYGGTPSFDGRASSGTAAAPSATVATAVLCQLTGFGYGATGYSGGSRAAVQLKAAESWTDAAQGTTIDLLTTPAGSNAIALKLRLDGSGNLLLNGASSPGSSAAGVIALPSGTAPTTSPASTVQIWTQLNGSSNANLFARNEAGAVEQLTGMTAVVASVFSKTSSTTLADITGLSRNVLAGKTYIFEAHLYTTSNSAGGVQFAISGTATATAIVYEALVTEGATGKAQSRATAMGASVGAVTAVSAALVKISGTITVNAAGTLTVQFAQNASNGSASSVLVGSWFRLKSV